MLKRKTHTLSPSGELAGHERHQLRQQLLERMVNSEADLKRFWSKVSKENEWFAGCWEWTAATNKGYGVFRLSLNKNVSKCFIAPRIAYYIKHRTLADGLCVCHHCDNPLCVNPEHLFLGTAQDNNDDKTSKWRHTYGERNTWAKLTEKQVHEIMVLHSVNKISMSKIAPMFGVTRKAISMIISGERWKHVQPSKECIAGAKIPHKWHLVGEKHRMAKLSEEQVQRIRVMVYTSRLSIPKVAKKFGVSHHAVRNIISGKTWKHLPEPVECI